MKKHKIYTQYFQNLRLLILYLSSFLFILSSLIFIFYYTNEQIQASDLNLNHIYNRLNQYFTSSTHYSKLLLNNNTIQKGFSLYYTDKQSFKNQKANMLAEINKFIYPAPYIYTISLYDKNHNMVISSERKFHNSKFENNKIENGKWILSEKYALSKDELISVFSYIQSFYDYRNANLFGYIEVSISEQSINDIYKSSIKNEDLYIIVDKNANILSSSDSNKIMDKNLISKIINNEKKHIFTKNAFINNISILNDSCHLIHIIPLYSFIKPTFSIAIVFLLITGFYLILALLSCRRLALKMTEPIYKLIKHTNLVKSGSWSLIEYQTNILEMGLLIENFNHMIMAQNDLKNQLINLEKSKNKLEIAKINEQLKPHFLYNTLDNIYSLASLDEKETLLNLVMELSKFYRSCLHLGKSFVNIKDELNTCKSYLEIMLIRYPLKFEYEIIYDKNLENYICPKLILLPLVENSIYHGIKALNKKGKINIIIKEEKNKKDILTKNYDIKISIIDNGLGFDLEKINNILNDTSYSSKHFALKHINQILKIYYNSQLNFKQEKDKSIVYFRIKKEINHEN